MTAMAQPRRDSLTPALLAAGALHIALFAALILLAKPPSIPPLGDAVPITIVSRAPVTDSKAAEAAPVTQTAAVETPVPRAAPPAPPPAPPAPAPTPTPVRAAARPKPAPAPVKPAPAVKPQPARPDFSLDALQASIAKAARSTPPRPAVARRGPARAETAPQARVDAGQGVSQSDLQGLQQLLERLWNPNCAVAGADAVIVPVRFQVADDGRVIGRVTEGGRESSSDPVVFAAARRAIDAVHQAAPYAEAYRGKSFTVNFDAGKACAGR